MNCVQCSAIIPDSWRFCNHCGSPRALERIPSADLGGNVGRRTNADFPAVGKAEEMPAGDASQAMAQSSGSMSEPRPHASNAVSPLVRADQTLRSSGALDNPANEAAPEARSEPRVEYWGSAEAHAGAQEKMRASARTHRNIPWKRLAIASAIILLFAGTATTLSYQWARDHTRLVANRHALTSSKAALAKTIGQRDALDKGLDYANLKITDLRAEIAGIQTSLGRARSRVELQAGQIDTLKTCLNGVSRALGYVIYENIPAAIGELDGVRFICQKAQRLIGSS